MLKVRRRPAGRRAGHHEETGAYLVMYALMAVAMFTMAAVVLDIAALRQGRRADRTAVDLSVAGGVGILDPDDPATFASACRAAWGYVMANRTEAGGPVSPPDCDATFPPADACSTVMGARSAPGSIGPLTIEITHPVPDSSPLMDAEAQGGDQPQAVDPTADGISCGRMAVRIVRSRRFLFGQIAGIVGGTTDVHSVARGVVKSTSDILGVVALERTGCDGLLAISAGGQLEVQGVGQPGMVAVDSDASTCVAPGFTVQPGPARIRVIGAGAAPGVISSVALAGSYFARAYDPAAVGAGRLSPAPIPAPTRTGRAPIDTRYNCLAASCAVGADHVDQLEARLQGPGAPAGYNVYAGPCTLGPLDLPVVLLGDMFVDCPVFDVGNSMTFAGAGTVFTGDVIVRSTGCLAVNDVACGAFGLPLRDAVVFIRNGGLAKETSGRLVLNRTFVHASGAIDIPFDPSPAPDSEVTWTAPFGGVFEDLLLWNESAAGTRLGGQDSGTVEGTLFAPNASSFVLETRGGGTGRITWPAQVITKRLRLESNGDVILAPAAGRATGRLTRQVRLIR